ncbi:unnamed protein product [Laminaria digitata]
MTEAEESDKSIPYFFPDECPVRYTLQVFPHSAAVKDAAGAPWACSVSPFVDTEPLLIGDDGERPPPPPPPVPIDKVARCEECFAYISPFSDITTRYWKCALCGHMSRITQELSRYRQHNAFQVLPELSQETVEFELPLKTKGAKLRSGEVLLEAGYLAKEPAAARPVVYLAVVDECGGQEYHDVMAEASVLEGCARNLPDETRLGAVTMSDRLGLVDLQAPLPHVQFIDMGLGQGVGAGERVGSGSGSGSGGGGGDDSGDGSGSDGDGGAAMTSVSDIGAVGLSDVMSLDELFCPLGGNRERISANVRGLRRACRAGGDIPTGESVGSRATGLTVKLLLDLLLGVGAAGAGSAAHSGGDGGGQGDGGKKKPAVDRGEGFTFAGCRLMLFLGGAADRGPGAVGAVSLPPAAAAAVGGEGGGNGEGEGDGFVHDQLFRGESKALGFYRGQAYRAASRGVSVDVHCFASKTCKHFGLSSMAPLALTTGGSVFRHSLLHQREGEERVTSLGKEVCAELLRPRVYDGAFAMDFEFRGGGGGAQLEWSDEADTSSIVQSAFAYTAVIPSDDVGDETDISGGGGGGDPKAARMVTVQRLRVSTVKTEASPSVGAVAMMADPATVAAVLAHKVVSEARRR